MTIETTEKKVLTFKKEKYGSANAFECFSFVADARRDEKKKGHGLDFASMLYYDAKKKRLWATDGHRLHLCKIDMGKSDRHFSILNSKKNEIILQEESEERPSVPNISAILKEHKTIARQKVNISEDHPEYAYVDFMRLFQKAGMQQRFFNDLTIYNNSWTALIAKEDSAQCFKSEDCLAMIMLTDPK